MRTCLALATSVVLAYAVPTTSAQTYFPPADDAGTWATVEPTELDYCDAGLARLDSFLAATSTRSFILLRDGRIAHERYFGGQDPAGLRTWNSSGKSLLAVLVATAVDRGLVGLDDPAGDYLGAGWTSCDTAAERAITLRHLLTMTSGLDDSGDVNCTDPACLTCLAAPGSRWAYHTAASTQLTYVLEAASGLSLNEYTREVLLDETGIRGAWSRSGDNRFFASDARGFARWSVLLGADLAWDGAPLIADTALVRALTTPSQNLNPAYGYLFWLNGQSSYRLPGRPFEFLGAITPEAPSPTYYSIGKNGQIASVAPGTGLTWVRMGVASAAGGRLVSTAYADAVWTYVNALACASTSTGVDPPTRGGLAVYPNPAAGAMTISADAELAAYALLDPAGRTLRRGRLAGRAATIDAAELPPGPYVVRIQLADGSSSTARVTVAP